MSACADGQPQPVPRQSRDRPPPADDCGPSPKRRKVVLEHKLQVPAGERASDSIAATRRRLLSPLTVQNVVMMFSSGPFDLEKVAHYAHGCKSRRFADSVHIKFHEPHCTVEVFQRRVLILGVCSVSAGQLVASIFAATMSEIHGRPFAIRNLLPFNMLATFHVDGKVDLRRLHLSLLHGNYNAESIRAVFAAFQVVRGDVPQATIKKTNKRVTVAHCIETEQPDHQQPPLSQAAAPTTIRHVPANAKGATLVMYAGGGVVSGLETYQQLEEARDTVYNYLVHFISTAGGTDGAASG